MLVSLTGRPCWLGKTDPLPADMRILALETSCDESSVAWLDSEAGILEQRIHSQMAMHAAYGGVVPDLASREHLHNLPPLLNWAFEQQTTPTHLAVTHGPGLAACLALGIASARALSMAWDALPIFPVNHLHGHAYSPFIDTFLEAPMRFDATFAKLLPHLGLIVSGGNTLLFSLDTRGAFQVLAHTVDDAAGEALDKGAKLLGLGYPGGPWIEKHAQSGNPKHIAFPRAFPQRDTMKFSFSGLKTSLRYKLEAMDDATLAKDLPDICASYQQAVIDQLIKKTGHALPLQSFRSLGLSGGVANNSPLRDALTQLGKRKRIPTLLARREHTGDNAAMIAFAAYMRRDLPIPSLTLQPSLPFA